MALPEFSTLTTVQQRANSKRILGWTDNNNDSIPDPGKLTQGYQFASGLVFSYLTRRYGETVLAAWTISTAPGRVLAISDDLCVYWFSSSNNAQSELINHIYLEAIAALERIRDGVDDLYGVTEDMSERAEVDDADSSFDEDITYYNE